MTHNKAGQPQVDMDMPSSITRSSPVSAHLPSHNDTHHQSHRKGSCDPTADSFFIHALVMKSPKQWRRAERNTRKGIHIDSLSLLILTLNLEEGDFNLFGPCSLKTKLAACEQKQVKQFHSWERTRNAFEHLTLIFFRDLVSFWWFDPQAMWRNYSIAGTTILQTTLEDADKTQFIDGMTNPLRKVVVGLKAFRYSTPSRVLNQQ